MVASLIYRAEITRAPVPSYAKLRELARLPGARSRGSGARRTVRSRSDERPQAEVLADRLPATPGRRALGVPRRVPHRRALLEMPAQRGLPGSGGDQRVPQRARTGCTGTWSAPSPARWSPARRSWPSRPPVPWPSSSRTSTPSATPTIQYVRCSRCRHDWVLMIHAGAFGLGSLLRFAVEPATHATVLLDHIRESFASSAPPPCGTGVGRAEAAMADGPRLPGQTPRTSSALLSGRPRVRVTARALDVPGRCWSDSPTRFTDRPPQDPARPVNRCGKLLGSHTSRTDPIVSGERSAWIVR